jgi:hypothetical protein
MIGEIKEKSEGGKTGCFKGRKSMLKWMDLGGSIIFVNNFAIFI